MKHIFAVSALAGTACLQHCMFVQCFFSAKVFRSLCDFAEIC